MVRVIRATSKASNAHSSTSNSLWPICASLSSYLLHDASKMGVDGMQAPICEQVRQLLASNILHNHGECCRPVSSNATSAPYR